MASHDSVATMKGGEAIVKTALDAFGSVDILINNAGILRDKTFVKMSETDWDTVLNVHLKGAFCVTQPAVKIMIEKDYGRIVFTSSASGLYGNFGQSNYGAAKMGVVGIMNTLKLELAKYDICVNTIAPNAWSRMTEDLFPREFEQKMRPEHVAPMVLYLCSHENRISGMIFTAGAGWYGRSAVMSGSGLCLGCYRETVLVEEIRDHFDQLASLENAKTHDSGLSLFSYMDPVLNPDS